MGDLHLPDARGGRPDGARLGQAPFLIDGAANHVRFLFGDRIDGTLEGAYPGSTWTRIPLFLEGTSPCVRLTVGGQPLRFFLDSGSNDTSLWRNAVEKLALSSRREVEAHQVDLAGESSRLSERFVVEHLELGNWSCTLEFDVEHAGARFEDRFDGILGFDLLSRVPVVIDVRGGALWVLDPKPGERAVLRATYDDRLDRYLTDRWWVSRMYGARGAVYRGEREWVDRAILRLDDAHPQVRAAAARAIEELAEETWPDAERIDRARSWWAAHRRDAAHDEE